MRRPCTSAGVRRLEGGDWRLESGGWKLETGGWKLEGGSGKGRDDQPVAHSMKAPVKLLTVGGAVRVRDSSGGSSL